MRVKVGGTWKDTTPNVKVGGTWRNVDNGYVKIGGVWKEFYKSFTPLIVGVAGSVAVRSTDGISWTSSSVNGSGNFTQMAYGNNVFVTTNSTNISLSSSDGIIWQRGTMPSSGNWKIVISVNNSFFAFRDSSNLYAISTNGITWTQYTLPISTQWGSCAYGGGKFVLMRSSQDPGSLKFYHSTDGISWTLGNVSFTMNPGSDLFHETKYFNQTFISFASQMAPTNTYITSTNSTSWTLRTLPIAGEWRAASSGSLMVAVPTQVDNVTDARCLYSTNGITWTIGGSLPVIMNGQPRFYGISYSSNSNRFVLSSGTFSAMAESTNGVSWTRRTLPSATANIYAISSNN